MGNELPKKKYITKAEFARLIGVNKSQVTRAVQSGRISQTGSGTINWKRAITDWKTTRRDSLKGRGIANNTNKKPKFEPLPDVPGVDERDHINDGLSAAPNDPPIKAPKGRKPEALAEAILREEIAKADRQEMRASIERGELFERSDILNVYGEILNKLKGSVLAFPQRTMQDILCAIKQWLSEQNIKVDASKFAPLETLIINAVSKESRIVLTSITGYANNSGEGLDALAKKAKKKK